MKKGTVRAERTNYVQGNQFTLDRRYDDFKVVGKGSYGVVCSALDEVTGKRVAIKKITPVCKHTIDAKHVLREIRLMRHMGKHENIVTLEDLYLREHADELYIVMELLDSDLHRVLQSKQNLTENHYKYFFHQLLCGVKYLHKNRIIHRDLKPGNLLVSRDCKLRITDFGLARERPIGKNTADPDTNIDFAMTEHVVTRWYRPCELMLCPDGLYTYAVDLWSCGCILGEMLGRDPMFPGKNFVHQLSLIFNVIGSPEQNEVSHIKNTQAKKFLESQRGKKRVNMQSLYPHASPEALELLDSLLVFLPENRLGIDDALKSKFLNGVAVGSPSLVFPETSNDFEFAFEYSNPTKYQLKEMIQHEVDSFCSQIGPDSSRSSAGLSAGVSAGVGAGVSKVTAASSGMLSPSRLNTKAIKKLDDETTCANATAVLLGSPVRKAKENIPKIMNYIDDETVEEAYPTVFAALNDHVAVKQASESVAARKGVKKPSTVAKAPTFSLMSWQRKDSVSVPRPVTGNAKPKVVSKPTARPTTGQMSSRSAAVSSRVSNR